MTTIKNIFVEYVNSIVKEFFIESTFRSRANFWFWRQLKRKWLCNRLFDEKIILHRRQKINVDVTKWINNWFFFSRYLNCNNSILASKMLRLHDSHYEKLSQSQLYSIYFSHLSRMFCLYYHDSRRIFFLLSKTSIAFVLDFDTSFSNRTRFRKSNAKAFFVKKTTKQIEYLFRRRTNIDIFDFDKQNFDIDKKYNRKTINKKIEKTRNRRRQIVEKNDFVVHDFAYLLIDLICWHYRNSNRNWKHCLVA